MMKGVAILMMVFYHLFLGRWIHECTPLIWIGGKPLISWLIRSVYPVSFYLILGGYGMYRVYEKGDRNRWTRVLKLALHYWTTLAIFIGIGCFMYPGRYPGSINELVSNVTGFHTTYNGEMWFLLPYVILSLIAPLIFRAVARIRAIYVVGATFMLHMFTSFCISRYGDAYFYNNYWLYTPLLVLHLMFAFMLGAMAARSRIFERMSEYKTKRATAWIAGGLILVLLAVNTVCKYNYFYEFIFICCFLMLRLPAWLKNILCKFGEHSMNIWMIHTWFCYYLFKDLIYSFEYPLAIYGIMLVICYLSSVGVNWICRPLEGMIGRSRKAAVA